MATSAKQPALRSLISHQSCPTDNQVRILSHLRCALYRISPEKQEKKSNRETVENGDCGSARTRRSEEQTKQPWTSLTLSVRLDPHLRIKAWGSQVPVKTGFEVMVGGSCEDTCRRGRFVVEAP